MASYFVWLSLGLNPSTATEIYLISSPMFADARIELKFEQGSLHITANNLTPENKYIVSMTLDKREHDRAWLYHWEIKNGAELHYEMGPVPSEFAIHNLPPSDTLTC